MYFETNRSRRALGSFVAILGLAAVATAWTRTGRETMPFYAWGFAFLFLAAAFLGTLLGLAALRGGSERVRDWMCTSFMLCFVAGLACGSVPLLAILRCEYQVRAAERWCEAQVPALDAYVQEHGMAPVDVFGLVSKVDAPRLVREGHVKYEAINRAYTFQVWHPDHSPVSWLSWQRRWASERL